MNKKYHLILLMTVTSAYAVLPVIETNNSFSAVELIKYKDNKLFIKGKPSIDKAQVNTLIYTKTDLPFQVLTWPNEQEVAETLKEKELTAEKTELIEKKSTIEFLENGMSKEHTSLTFLLQPGDTQPTLFSYDPILADAKINKVLLYSPGKPILSLNPKNLVRARTQANNRQLSTYMATSYSPEKRLLYVEYQLTTLIPHINNQICQTIDFQNCNNSLELIIPKNFKLKYSTNFGTPSHTENRYHWEVKKGHSQYKQLYLSTYSSWDEIIKERQAEFKIPITTTAEMTSLAKKITQACINNKERVELVFNWIQTHIAHDQEQTSISSILVEKRGDLKSRTILLNKMLKGLKIESSIALTFASDIEIPYNNYQNIICTFKLESNTHYLDLSSVYFRFPYFPDNNIGKRIIELESGLNSTIKTPDASISTVTKALELNLAKTKVQYKLNSTYGGEDEAILREQHKKLSSDQFKIHFVEKMSLNPELISSFELKNADDFVKPLSVKIDYTREKQVITTDKQKLFYIPELKLYHKSQTYHSKFNWIIKIKIPKGYSPIAKEEVTLKDSRDLIVLNKTEEVKEGWLYIKLNYDKSDSYSSKVKIQMNYILSQPLVFNKNR